MRAKTCRARPIITRADGRRRRTSPRRNSARGYFFRFSDWQLQDLAYSAQIGRPRPHPTAFPEVYADVADANALSEIRDGQTACNPRIVKIAAQAWLARQQANSFGCQTGSLGP